MEKQSSTQTTTKQSAKEEAPRTNLPKLGGNVTITPVGELPNNMAIMIWGPGGVGKTTLACTAPGQKLLLNFDPRGPASVAYRDDVAVGDYSTHGSSIVEEFKRSDPFNLSSVIGSFDSLIVDSLTTIGDLTVARGIELTKGATIERPSPGAYGARNALILQLVTNVLKLAEKHSKHVIFIAHEGSPERNDENQIVSIPMYLGGQLPTQTSVRFSEVWAMYELGSGKTIAIRACRSRGPIKTRMFQTTSTPEFAWKYNPETDEGMKIADWHEAWLKGGKKKLALPK